MVKSCTWSIKVWPPALTFDTGRRIEQTRLKASGAASVPPPRNGDNAGGGRSRGGRGSGGGRGGQDYSSPVVAGSNLYYASRSGDVFVVELGDDMQQIASNRLGDGGQYNSTPAISNGELFLRSTRTIYCVAANN